MSRVVVKFDEEEVKTRVIAILADRLYRSLLGRVGDKNEVLKRAEQEVEKRLKDEMYERIRNEVKSA